MDAQEQHDPNRFTAQPFPRMRRLVLDSGWMAARKHLIHGFVEMDVSEPRRKIRALAEETGEKLSFTAFILHCLGRAVATDRAVHAVRDWRNRLIIFDDVDVLITIEIPTDAGMFPMVHPIRACDRRDPWDIHREIRAVQARPVSGELLRNPLLRSYMYFPAFIRRLGYRLIERLPHLRKRYAGTVGLTAVGMFARDAGIVRSGVGFYGLSAPAHNLAITLGGMETRPALVGDEVQPRDYLHVTMSFEHGITDGAPATRFAGRFLELVESGHGIETPPS